MTDPAAPRPNDEPLRSVHSTTFPELLERGGLSVAISTYQANKLIVARADRGQLNTHFRPFDRPMGMAAKAEKLAIGTEAQIWELSNVPAAAAKLDPAPAHPNRVHDACFLPRRLHVTGDIDIHEMAYGRAHNEHRDELWFINTRFSCLCTLDVAYSFVPRWRPPFVTGYDLSDRCHLNGLALRDGKPRYTTALGQTDTPTGWRKRKATGGVLMDVTTDDILVEGLSMPHSPRWYRDRLWVLESGRGALSTVDLATGKLTDVACLPGFTRGLSFWGNYAFVGLSQVRESAIFSGIEIAKQAERYCGVWVVDIVSGQVVALLRFEAAVQEIFAVQVLAGMAFPDVLTDDRDRLAHSYVVPDAALQEVVNLENSDLERFPAVPFERGNRCYAAGDFVGAIEAYRACLDLDPNYPEATYQLGQCHMAQRALADAIGAFEQVLETDPNHARALWDLGQCHANLGNGQLADTYRDRACAIDPNVSLVVDGER
ncbi:MAG: TIGR03032 family protein [Geitlerinemataceae cyanobacterium]